ncbi:MAG TPA: hypothetical protein VFW23_08265, partial [Tepidisphaeraceae bacterium]|nr:hypothetical protein [Tepidisphaeraceae bacterium]
TIAFHNVRMDMSAGTPLQNTSQTGHASVWLDNVEVFGSLANGGTMVPIFEPTDAGNLYVTGCDVHDLSNTPFTLTNLIRNTQIHDCFVHGANDPYLMINTTIDNIVARPNNPDDHVDGIFWYNPGVDENSIVYGATLTNIDGLCLMSDQPPMDIAVINVSATATADAAGGQSQFGKVNYTLTEKHIVIDDLTLTNQSLVLVATTGNTWSDSIIENSVLWDLFDQPNPVVNCTKTDGTPIPNQS